MFKSPTDSIVILLLVVVILYLVKKQESQPSVQLSTPPLTQQPPVVISVANGDSRYSRPPRPQRFWDNGPEYPVRGALDPVPTRGAPEAYQQMGVVTSSDGKILPLYGRRVAARSDYFNYYTRTDTYNPVALPITFQKRDCQDNVGCQELMSGSEVRIQPNGEVGKVMLYGFDGPRYTPDIA